MPQRWTSAADNPSTSPRAAAPRSTPAKAHIVEGPQGPRLTGLWSRAARVEKAVEQRAGVVLADAAEDLEHMIEGRVRQRIDGGAQRSRFRLRRAVHETRDACVHEGTDAHQARLH